MPGLPISPDALRLATPPAGAPLCWDWSGVVPLPRAASREIVAAFDAPDGDAYEPGALTRASRGAGPVPLAVLPDRIKVRFKVPAGAAGATFDFELRAGDECSCVPIWRGTYVPGAVGAQPVGEYEDLVIAGGWPGSRWELWATSVDVPLGVNVLLALRVSLDRACVSPTILWGPAVSKSFPAALNVLK